MPVIDLPLGVTAVMLPELDFPEQIALCKRLGVTHYSIRPRVIPDAERDRPYSNWGNHKFDLTPERLLREARAIRKQLDDAGLVAFGTVPAATVLDSDDDLKIHFEGAAAVAAGRVRVAPERYPAGLFDYQTFLDRTITAYQRVVRLARPFALKVVIETHCFSIAASPCLAWNICRHFKADELGTIFDLANFNIEGGLQPHLAVSVLGPYIDHVHIGASRRVASEYDSAGFLKGGMVQSPLTEAHLYMPAWIKALADTGRKIPLIIENFTGGVPGADRLVETAHAIRRAVHMLEQG